MHDEVIEQFYDVLQNIEASILETYDVEPDLLDLDVIDALDALIRRYAAEDQGRTPPASRLSARAARVVEAAGRICEWRMGRLALEDIVDDAVIPPHPLKTIAEIVVCLKRLRKSVNIWNEEGGRQGYLDYVSEFFNQMQRGASVKLRLS
jgi:hypothetical protein